MKRYHYPVTSAGELAKVLELIPKGASLYIAGSPDSPNRDRIQALEIGDEFSSLTLYGGGIAADTTSFFHIEGAQ